MLHRSVLAALAALAACAGKGGAIVDDAAPADGAPDAPAPAIDATPPDAPAPDAPRPDAMAPCVPPPPGTAPTYTDLYTRYFAPGTPGHCAEDSCHGGDGYHNWPCGPGRDGCYAGMLERGLIDPLNPVASVLASARFSPISWVSPNGSMPRDGTRPFPPGGSALIARDEIIAWATACAQDD